MIMRAPLDLTADEFEAAATHPFDIPSGEAGVLIERLTLRSVTRKPPLPSFDRERFSLFLDGSRTDIAIDGQEVLLSHETMGQMRLFMVPIGRNPDGTVRYQIVFS
ncbi:MAG: hypothetical protein CMO30_13560 [Tistrella sp.]|uniref:DUF6916 domain-containing protein n=2 Tax=Tistrella TaxID=171436 RepID=A0A3B9IRQ8_9PROT|nr:hypothetical protein [Tistrella sp.]MBA76294.1 hypothetical protein [Tistrella sp.]HAE49993.1 hypothetical protein [Tistrella mobilis]|tara:strand:+ start:1481 stop:1798 length:318 start_codon:yes stop_codon:yes gene_type:complete